MNKLSQDIVGQLRALRPRLKSELGITRLRVFGSVGRGEAREDSDIDLIADFDDMPGLAFFTMDQKVSNMLGGRSVDFTTEGGLHKRLRGRILREARDVW